MLNNYVTAGFLASAERVIEVQDGGQMSNGGFAALGSGAAGNGLAESEE